MLSNTSIICVDRTEIHAKYVVKSTMRQDVLNLLDDLAAQERGGITTAEVRQRLEMSEQSASNLMTRLVHAGFLDRVALRFARLSITTDFSCIRCEQSRSLCQGASNSSASAGVAYSRSTSPRKRSR